jgi:hypothetical protein
MTPAVASALATFQGYLAGVTTLTSITKAQEVTLDVAGTALIAAVLTEAAAQDLLILSSPVVAADILATLAALNNESAYLDAYAYVGRAIKNIENDLG